MASTDESSAVAGGSDTDASWLSELYLGRSRRASPRDEEETIMRLSSSAELLHSFLVRGQNEAPPPAVLIRDDRLLRLACGRVTEGSSAQIGFLAGAYRVAPPGAEPAVSLEPHAFFATSEDAREAIAAQSDTLQRDDPVQRYSGPGTRNLQGLAAMGFVILLIWALSLA